MRPDEITAHLYEGDCIGPAPRQDSDPHVRCVHGSSAALLSSGSSTWLTPIMCCVLQQPAEAHRAHPEAKGGAGRRAASH